ncbi:hypothetical protein ON010_g2009 [Phytophthora cinnamomi]|nr:hypothetical protein ON010_g2009 [Phytophthora cinnamomi]
MEPSYFYLRPGSFDMVGCAYGKTECPTTRGGKLKVKLVPSGRWEEEQVQSIELTQDELSPRAVTDEEALDGVGTFVESAICVSRVRPGGAHVWDYGLVVGYKWDSKQRQGWLDVNLNGGEVAVIYSPESVHDVAAEIYALQPCAGKSTSLVMASEVRQKHLQVYNAFNGINQAATRDSKELLAAVGSSAIDESKSESLLAFSSFEVSEIPIQLVLDYVFYKQGDREHPAGASFSYTTETQNDPPRTSRDAAIALSDGLSDSEDEVANPPAGSRRTKSSQQPAPKRRRLEVTAPATATPRTPAASRFAETSRPERDVESLVSLHRSTGSGEPTGMQSTIHLALITGMYAQMTAQRFVEFVQIYWRKFEFFSHPAVLRALFGWDFGTRGSSILHFVRVTEQEKQVRVRGNGMNSFSRKYALPAAPTPAESSEICGTIDVLCVVTQQLYKSVVHDTLVAASRFFGELCVTNKPGRSRGVGGMGGRSSRVVPDCTHSTTPGTGAFGCGYVYAQSIAYTAWPAATATNASRSGYSWASYVFAGSQQANGLQRAPQASETAVTCIYSTAAWPI